MRMYDAGKIISGLLIFVCLILFPSLYTAVSGKVGYVPKPKVIGEEKKCIESTPYMRTQHTDLLIEWRDSVVRRGLRTYTASEGKKYTMGLTETCMKCHSNKAEFCDQCHNYAGVKPYCWDCHNYPKEAKK